MDSEINDRLDRIEDSLRRITAVLDQVQPNVAMAVDIADEYVRDRVRGDAVEKRVDTAVQALFALSEPGTLHALTRMAQQAPRLEKAVDLVAAMDDHVAMASDIADEFVRDRVGGASMESRLDAAMNALMTLSEPRTLEALTRLAAQAPKLEGAVQLAADFEDHVGLAAEMADAMRQPAPQVGVLGLFGSLHDPEVQRGLGRLLHITRALGQERLLGASS